ASIDGPAVTIIDIEVVIATRPNPIRTHLVTRSARTAKEAAVVVGVQAVVVVGSARVERTDIRPRLAGVVDTTLTVVVPQHT
ncbi:unnamed protein product, partial [Echinostoma caproni]|uniref:Transcriptional regulator n=1 Tax=Echinostoma caproni TaxID=27848 RepID=A0A183BH85_9TREM